jgi:mono/diheme cytochrome c family protein
LRFQNVPELLNVPWEYMYDEAKDVFFARSRRMPLVRSLDLLDLPPTLATRPPLNVIVVLSSPTNVRPIDVEKEWDGLQAVSKRLGDEQVKFYRIDGAATLTSLARILRDPRVHYHGLHFVGHGDYDDVTKTGTLLFETERGRASSVSADVLGELLRDTSISFAVLNSCLGATTDQLDPFAGVAQALIRNGLAAVIGMQHEISSTAAVEFAEAFYEDLIHGYPIDTAVVDGRATIRRNDNELEWATPVLYMGSVDGRIFASPRGDEGVETRMRFSREAAEAVTDIQRTAPRGSPHGSAGPFTAPDSAAVNEILSQPLWSLATREEQITWAEASLAAGNYADAQRALNFAISQVGDRPDAALAYVASAYKSSENPDYARIVSVLHGAHRRLEPATSLSVRQQVTEELINAYLYIEPPGGFKAALSVLDEYLDGDGKDQPNAYVFAAAAHGQKYTWAREHHDAGTCVAELPIICSLVKTAIELGDYTTQWLQGLATSFSGDDDLVQVSNDSKELRVLLSLPDPDAQRRADEGVAKLEAQRHADKDAAKLEAQRRADEEAAKLEAQRRADDEAAKLETQRRADEEAAKLETQRRADEEAAKLETQRCADEEAAKLEAQRRADEEAAKLEAQRRADEEAAKLEAQRRANEEAAKLETQRRAAEEAAKPETQRRAVRVLVALCVVVASAITVFLLLSIRPGPVKPTDTTDATSRPLIKSGTFPNPPADSATSTMPMNDAAAEQRQYEELAKLDRTRPMNAADAKKVAESQHRMQANTKVFAQFDVPLRAGEGVAKQAAAGSGVYSSNCAGCHNATGSGQPGVFPPLANNPMVTGDPKAVIHTISYGLNGSIRVGDATYSGMMPAWKGNLTDQQIADVITYIRSSWGNNAAAVSAADVHAVTK